MIRLPRPGCRKTLGVQENLVGRLVACPQCRARIRVPPPEDEEVEELEEVEDDVVESISTTPRPGRRPPPQSMRRATPKEEERREAARRRPRPRYDDAEDEEEEEEPRPRPIRKRKKKRRDRRPAASGGLNSSLITLVVVSVLCIAMVAASIFLPALALVPIGLGWITALVGGIWFLVVAFQEDAVQGLLCLFVPFYSLFYLFTHFEEVKKPFFVQVVGLVLCIGGACAGGFRGAKTVTGPSNLRGQIQAPWSLAGRSA